MRRLRVVIACASPGGLFTATLLRQDGHTVQVLERSAADLAGRGAGPVARPEGIGLLREIGEAEAAGVGVVARERIRLDRDGRVNGRQETPQMQVSWNNLFRTVRVRPKPAAAVAAEPQPFVQAIFDHGSLRMTRYCLAVPGDAMPLRDQLRQADLPAVVRAYEVERRPVGQAIAAYGPQLGASLG